MAPPLMASRAAKRSVDEDDVEEPLMNQLSGLEHMDRKNGQPQEDPSRVMKLVVSFAAMVFFGLGNKTIPMKNYPFFLNLWTTFIYIPVSFVYIIPMMLAGRISKEERNVSQVTFLVMGCLDGIASLMQIFAVTKIASGALLILLSQSAIPLSMLISRLLLKTSYTATQYTGALVVMLGITIVLYPSLSSSPTQGGNGTSPQETLIWSAVMMLSCIPMALSNVYKEKVLAGVDMDAMYLNGFVALYQFILCIPSAIPAAFAQNMPLEDIPRNCLNGFHCYVGQNSITNATNPIDNDDCSAAPLDVNVYLCFNVMYNILMILILKYGSANVLFLALTIMVPLGNFAFSFPWMPGHQDLTPNDYVGLFTIMGGLILYRFAEQLLSLCRGKRDDGL